MAIKEFLFCSLLVWQIGIIIYILQELNEADEDSVSDSYEIQYIKGEDGFFLRNFKRNEKLYIERSELDNIMKGLKQAR
ncbi:hypothetical protein HN615_13500 [Candidatus Woesearchaeota archaeon]|nr:hypothetical protein [Candidatus Woesearchaeota archaeon]